MDKGNGTTGLIVGVLVVALFIGVAYVVVNQRVSPVSPAPSKSQPGPNGQGTVTNDQSSSSLPAPRDRAGCEAQGGQWGIFGLRGEVGCNLPAPDAGKLCRNKADCVSLCVTSDTTAPGTLADGVCYGWTITTGSCFNVVEKGRVQGQLCTD